MRVALIILLWFLVGAFFWWSKSNCCAETEVTPSSIESEKLSETMEDKTAKMSDYKNILSFQKSDHVLTKDSEDNDSLLQSIKQRLVGGEGLLITGFAFSDEENPTELGMERAKSIKSFIDMPNANIKVRSELISEPFQEAVTFINYEYYDLDESNKEGTSVSNSNAAVVKTDDAYLFNLISDVDKEIPFEVKDKLKSIAKELRGNLKKVKLKTHSDNNVIASKWQRFAENYLIRYGVTPSRISSSYSTQGDHENAIMEISII